MNNTNILVANQRLIILQALKGDKDYSLNNGILERILVSLGHRVDAEDTNNVLAWLVSRDLITLEVLDDDISVAKLTRNGLKAARGHEEVAGVERPWPE